MRKEEFYSLMTAVFNSVAYDDGMDELLNIQPPQKKGPFSKILN